MELQHIVCPIDFSPQSDRALGYASVLAKESGAVLHIIHSYEEPFAYDPEVVGPVPPPADLDSIKQRLHETRATVDGVQTRHALLNGEPARAIREYAEQRGADLIVMGTHGRSGVARLLMGSVAENVLRHAICPVLVIKHPSDNS